MLSATSGKSLEYQALFCYNYIEQMFLFDDSQKKHLGFSSPQDRFVGHLA